MRRLLFICISALVLQASLVCFLVGSCGVYASLAKVNAHCLKELPTNPFSYDLGVIVLPSNQEHDEVTMCCHGYGHSNQIAQSMRSSGAPLGHIIGFNFPDYGITEATDHSTISYGSVAEIIPLCYLLKYYVCDLGIPALNLYGFSAGGGAIINALALIFAEEHHLRLAELGISSKNREAIREALTRGIIILDRPLKSMDEIIAFRGETPQLKIVAQHYNYNDMNPIDVLTHMHVSIPIIVHFQNPDEVLSNRDDMFFIERLRSANSGKTWEILGTHGGHCSYFQDFWDAYLRIKKLATTEF